jgi:SMI1 / KNR4 family (SUKH-1)
MTCSSWIARLNSRTELVPARVEAVQRLVLECRGDAAWRLFCRIAVEEDDDPDVRCAVVEAMSQWGHPETYGLLTRAFGNRKVSATALAALRMMAPASGDLEAQLLADIAAFKSDKANFGLIMFPNRYGADPRVLALLREALSHPDHYVREQAVSSLCCLGDAESALLAASDVSERVRWTLCNGLMRRPVPAGDEVLQQLSDDPDPFVAEGARIALRQLAREERPMYPRPPWRDLLAEISSIRLGDPEVSARVSGDVVRAGWLGEPGATEEQIRAAEERIGTKLPPSYREFLGEANGFREINPFFTRLFQATEIGWFRSLDPDWIEAFQPRDGDDVSPEDHLRDPLNSVMFRSSYLSSCLQISENGDGAVVLLNPEVMTPEGEWETWFFANWLPGAERYRSFRSYVESELERAYELSAVPSPEGA